MFSYEELKARIEHEKNSLRFYVLYWHILKKDMSEEELMQKANAWELKHGGMSGRTATRFITNLLGKEPEE